jgi:hypothetical protein
MGHINGCSVLFVLTYSIETYNTGKHGNYEYVPDNQLTDIEINAKKTKSVFLSRQQSAECNNNILVNIFSENI